MGKARRAPRRNESPLVNACLQVLKLRGIAATRHQCGHIYMAGRHINLGESGWPDIIGYMPDGRFLGIECKVGDGKLSGAQRQRGADIAQSRGVWAVVRSVADLADLLDGRT